MAVFQDVEKQFAERGIERQGLMLLRPADAVEYVAPCAEHGIEVLGIDAFRVDGDSIQPLMEHSIHLHARRAIGGPCWRDSTPPSLKGGFPNGEAKQHPVQPTSGIPQNCDIKEREKEREKETGCKFVSYAGGRRSVVKKSNIRFAQLRAFFEGIGFSATREKRGWRIEHPATATVFIFRPYRSNELVYAPDLFLVRSQLSARGMVAEDEFDESLTKTPGRL